ncbi:MAG: hypothetical protein HFJ55_02270 [Clostridia bacterium]|jgi:hypothetical protein|nr:hypothetical protein [Clostridia bacterium]
MSTYIKTIEVYRLGDGEMPKWLQDAITQKIIIFERKNMIDTETFKECKNAIVGIKRAGNDKVYDVDSYIVKDSFKNLIKVVDVYDFEQEGYQKARD